MMKITAFPNVFYSDGKLHPIKHSFIGLNPNDANFAIYFNHQSKEPVQIYFSTITEINLNYLAMFEFILSTAKSDVERIEASMKKLEINKKC